MAIVLLCMKVILALKMGAEHSNETGMLKTNANYNLILVNTQRKWSNWMQACLSYKNLP